MARPSAPGTRVKAVKFRSYLGIPGAIEKEQLPAHKKQEVLIEEAVSPLTPADQDRIAHMVEAGFNAWREFHERFSQRRREIRSQEPGLATWDDIGHFLSEYTAAKAVDGFTASRFLINDGRVQSQEEQIRVLHLEGHNYFLGDHDGAVISGPESQSIAQLALNVPAVTGTLRKNALPATPTGAAHLRWPQDIPAPEWLPSDGTGILVFLRQTLRADQRVGWSEQASSLHCYRVATDGSTTAMQPDQKAQLFRAVFRSVVRTKPDERATLLSALAQAEARFTQELRRPDESEIRQGIRYAVTPLFAATITT